MARVAHARNHIPVVLGITALAMFLVSGISSLLHGDVTTPVIVISDNAGNFTKSGTGWQPNKTFSTAFNGGFSYAMLNNLINSTSSTPPKGKWAVNVPAG